MKTKFKVDLMSFDSYLTPNLIQIICNHNSGLTRVDLDVICGFILGERAKHIKLYPTLKIVSEGDNIIHVSADGVESFISITEIEVDELVPEQYIAKHGTVTIAN